VLKDEWKSLSREGDFAEEYYNMEFNFDGSWESFLDIWIDKAKEYGIYDGDVIESINTVADLFDDRIERQDEEGEDVEYDEKAWYNERENANYHSYDSYCILARYEYWMDFVRGGCKDPYKDSDDDSDDE
jgi:hypothetical protein